MMSMTTNYNGAAAVSKNLSDMSLVELTKEYNILAAKAGRSGVKKLRDARSGIKKIEALRGSSTKANKGAAEDPRSKISVEFDCRSGTNRERLVDALGQRKGRHVPRSDLLKAVYGNQKDENVGPLNMVMKGVEAMIKSGRLPYRIERQKDKDTKEISFGLLPK